MAHHYFMKVLDMSLAASVVIPAVLFLRIILKKAPKICSFILWAAVLIKLLCPFTFRTDFGIMPTFSSVAEGVEAEVMQIGPLDAAGAAYRAVGDALNGGLGVQHIRIGSESGAVITTDWWSVMTVFAFYVWLIGLLFMIVKSITGTFGLKRRLSDFCEISTGIRVSAGVDTPIVFGIIKPKIYLPESLAENEREYIICHERHHIARGDNITKLLFYIALCIHWFNPLVRLAFKLFCADMEMSCDEAVIGKLGENIKKAYSMSLLNLSCGESALRMPAAFAETDTAKRIKNLAKWKKRPVILVSVISGAAALLCVFLLSAEMPEYTSELPVPKGAYLVIKEAGVHSVEYSSFGSGGGCVNADGRAFEKGEHVYIESFESVEALRGMSLKAFDADENMIYSFDISETAEKNDITDKIISDPWFFMPEVELDRCIVDAVREHYSYYEKDENTVHAVTYAVIGGRSIENTNSREITVYAHILQQIFSCRNGEIEEGSGSYIPTVITFTDTGDGSYVLKEYWEPRDGSYNDDDIKRKFPLRFHSKAFDGQKYIKGLIAENETTAEEYFSQ